MNSRGSISIVMIKTKILQREVYVKKKERERKTILPGMVFILLSTSVGVREGQIVAVRPAE